MKKSKKAGLILTVGAALFLAAGAPALADETDTISKNVYIGGVNVSGMTEEQATKAGKRNRRKLYRKNRR